MPSTKHALFFNAQLSLILRSEAVTSCPHRNYPLSEVKKFADPFAEMLATLPLHEHGHNDVDVVVGTDGTEDAGAGGSSGFQSHLLFVQYRQDVREVLSIKGNLGRLTVN